MWLYSAIGSAFFCWYYGNLGKDWGSKHPFYIGNRLAHRDRFSIFLADGVCGGLPRYDWSDFWGNVDFFTPVRMFYGSFLALLF